MPGSVHEALLLGALQGFSELLPLSSDGHLLLAHLLVHSASPRPGLLALLHVGTLGAASWVLRAQLLGVLRAGLLSFRHPRVLRDTLQGRDATFLVLASLPTAVIGLAGYGTAAALATSPVVVAFGFLLTGALLVSSFWASGGRSDDPTALQALAIGVAQGLAVFPGLSRTAATVVVALSLGLRVTRAYELCVLASLPAVACVLALSSRELAAAVVAAPLPALVACVAAFGAGVLALRLLRLTLVTGLFPWFSAWVVPLGMGTLALAWAWPARGADARHTEPVAAATTSPCPRQPFPSRSVALPG